MSIDTPSLRPDGSIDFDEVARKLERRNAERARRERELLESVEASRDPGEKSRRHVSDRLAALREGRFAPRLIDRLAGGLPGAPPDGRAWRRSQAMTHAEAFLGTDKTVLVLVGGVGAGKTFAGMWVSYEAGGSRPGFVRSTHLERVGRYDREHQAWLDARTMLVLDDLGVELLDSKGAFVSLVDELVDKAWGNKSRLVITSNLDVKPLAERVGRRVWSRIGDVGFIGACGNEDLRRLP